MKNMILGAAVVAMSTMSAVPAHAASKNVFTENFETGFGQFTRSGGVRRLQGSYYTGLGFDGNAAAQANTYASFGPAGVRPTGGTLLAATIDGAVDVVTRYTLTFAAGVIGTNVGSQFLNVTVTGVGGDIAVVDFTSRETLTENGIDLTGSSNLNTALQPYKFTFDATGPISLEFLGQGLPGDGSDTLLDDVALTSAPVPEMSTWGMMILGFGVVGGSVRARRRKTMLATV